jgi:hypothetical protein
MFSAVELKRPNMMTMAIGAWISLPGLPADKAIAQQPTLGRRWSESKPPPHVLQCQNTGDGREQRQRRMAPKGKAKKSGMRGDQHHNREHCGPRARVMFMTLH